jgi:NAD(P)-dependent dehydrogenase (short-subunit alcohol dehydrogenase family)
MTMEQTLSGKVAIITGANQGFGLEVARTYLLAGADLMLCARNASLLEKARGELLRSARPGQKVIARAVDVSVESEVREMVRATIEELGGCHILVNNAGIYGPKGEIEDVDWAEWIKAIEINVYGSILMCRATLPHFKAQGYGKIIQLSGGGATSPMPRISAYAVSKAAIVRFAETLAEEVRGSGIDVNAIAPGALNTRMLDEVLEAGPEKVGKDFYERALKQRDSGGVPLNRGAELAVFLASPASDGITGKLISAVWDNWEQWPDHLQTLDSSDVYTLRRIVGRDRGFEQGDK